MRVWPAPDYTRVTLELDKPLAHELISVPNPPRLVVDLLDLSLDNTLRELVAKVQPDDPYIAQVRVGQFMPTVVRLVFDLKREVAPQLFALEPVGRYRHRLLLDLYPSVPLDPLAQFLGEMQSRDDPIAALLRERTPLAQAKPPMYELRPAPPVGAKPTPPSSTREPRQAREAQVARLYTIAIDAGHGGEDPGAIGHGGTREKDVVLAIARLLRKRINAEPNMRAFLTRNGDYFVPLGVLVDKARRVGADLFVSVHADAFVDPNASGASVYVLSEKRASSSAARWLADKENSADLIGGVNLRDHDQELARVLLELSTAAQIRDSSNLGQIVLGQLGELGKLHKSSIEKAGFAVLKAPDIPSILVETAFISNPQEEERLADRDYQAKIADAIHGGIRQFLLRYPPPAKGRPV